MFPLHPDGPYTANEAGAEPEEPGVRRRFVGRVFGFVGLQLAYGTTLLVFCLLVENPREFVEKNVELASGAEVWFIVSIMAMLIWRRVRRGTLGVVCLVAMTASVSYAMAYYSVQYSNSTVLSAAIATAIIILTVACFNACTDFDFTKYRVHITIFTLIGVGGLLIVFILGATRPNDRTLELLQGIFGTLISSVDLLYNVQTIMGRGLIAVKPGEVVYAMIMLYLSIIAAYWFLLLVKLL